MPQSAHITSVEAVEAFRARLVIYASKARPVLDDVTSEVSRTRRWLEEEQQPHWESQLKRRLRDLEDAQHAVFSARLSNLREVSAAEQMALTRAKRSVDEAQNKLKMIKHWRRQLDSMLEPLVRQLDKLQTVMAHEMPLAIAHLTRILEILAAYHEIGGSPSSAAASAGGADSTSPGGTDAPSTPQEGELADVSVEASAAPPVASESPSVPTPNQEETPPPPLSAIP